MCEASLVSKRADTSDGHLSNGIPSVIDPVEEITSQIEVLPMPGKSAITPEQASRVLASFESQLMELNRTLRESASTSVRKLRRECEKTEEEVHGLNSELSVVVKGDAG